MISRIFSSVMISTVLSLFNFGIVTAQDSPYRDIIDAAGCSDMYNNADIVDIFDSTDVQVEESGLSHITIHTLTKILTNDGAKSKSALRFDYDPASNMVEVKKIAVHKADGSVQEINLSGLIERPQPQYMIYWGTRMYVIGVPELNVGDALEVQYYTKGFMIAYLGDEDESKYIPPMRGHYYDTILFGTSHPIIHKVYVLKTMKEKPVQFKVYNGDVQVTSLAGLVAPKDNFIYVFEKKDIPVIKSEYSSPGASDYVTKVVLATVQDWEEKSKWFYEVNENSVIEFYGEKAKPFDFNDEIKEFTMKLIAPYKTDADKRKAILHWVAQHIRYSGISMGKGEGYTLHPGIMTWRDRAGVCKDIAGMSITMFRAAGYTSYPTMTMAGSSVERIPADQFNHCVAAVDISGEPQTVCDNLKGRAGFEERYEMYDATWAPNSMDIWSRYEGDQNIVIGSPQGEDLTAIRPYEPEEVKLIITSTATIDEDGNLTGTFDLIGWGSSDSRLRRLEAYGGNKEELANSLTDYLSNIAPGAELVDYNFGDLEDYWNQFPVTINYRIPGYALNYGDGLHFNSPAARFLENALFLRPIFRYARTETRVNPLFLYAPQNIVIEEEITVPKKYKNLTEIEQIEVGGEFANFKAQIEKSKNGTQINYEYVVSERFVDVEEYPQVWDITSAMKDFSDLNIHMWRK